MKKIIVFFILSVVLSSCLSYSHVDEFNSDNSLATLTVSEGTLVPAFDKDILNYTLILSGSPSDLTITATVTDEKATLKGDGDYSLNNDVESNRSKCDST